MFLANSTVAIVFYLSMPIIVGATVVGLIVALFQTVMQLQEQTLAFTAKLTVIVVVFAVSGTWMANKLLNFTQDMLARIVAL
ncbi:type III secretion system export apparatus subunit SctS [Ensifer sp. SL37]|nr:type III secretion system export apparatus subunit SctS [Ensifer sp. SL37]